MNETLFHASMTRGEAVDALVRLFTRSGVEEPSREARLVLRAACGVTPVNLIAAPDARLGEASTTLADFARRRAAGEPLSKISGRREFWGLSLSVSRDVLNPRPETETIVETAIELLGDRRSEPLRILDLGVGSGALLCALLTEFAGASGVGVDISPAAAEAARRNVAALGLANRAGVRVGSWTDGLEGPFDVIVSNPPYVRSGDIERLDKEVRDFDPRCALDGGSDGLDAYRAIIPASIALLVPNGWLLMEVGAGQSAHVLALVTKAGLVRCHTRPDIAGVERVVAAQRAGAAWS